MFNDKNDTAMTKPYIKPQTCAVRIQPQTMLAASGDQVFTIIKGYTENGEEAEAKGNHTYDVWGDDDEQ